MLTVHKTPDHHTVPYINREVITEVDHEPFPFSIVDDQFNEEMNAESYTPNESEFFD